MVGHVKSSNNCELSCLIAICKYFVIGPQPILQLVVNCTCVTIPFPLYKDIPLTSTWYLILARNQYDFYLLYQDTKILTIIKKVLACIVRFCQTNLDKIIVKRSQLIYFVTRTIFLRQITRVGFAKF
jgi:hypothetical protein